MYFKSLLNPALLAMAIGLSRASPMPLELTTPKFGGPDPDLLVQEGIRLAQSRGIEKRLSEDFSLDHEWNDEVLFGGSYTDKAPDTNAGVHLEVTCIECYTKGMVTANLWEDLFDPKLRLEFTDVEAYAFLGVDVTAGETFSINLFTSETPIGLAFPGISVGVVFFVDLVFSLTQEIDLTGGFHVKLANDAYLETDIFGGDISDSFFDGVSTKSLPITVHSGTATFKADLRLRVQAGAETEFDMIGIGAGAVVGVYANIIELVAVIEYTPACPLQTELWWNLNVGAFAELDVVVDYSTIGPVPTISTTLLEAPTLTHCWIEGGGASSSLPPPAITTTSSTISSSPSPSSPGPSSTPPPPPPPPSSSPFESSSHSPPYYSTDFPTATATSTPLLPSFPLVNSSSSAPSYPTATPTIISPDDEDEDDQKEEEEEDLITSTVYNKATHTLTHTLTRCAAPGAINCPTPYQEAVTVTRTVDVDVAAFTTVCPASSAKITAPSSPSSSSSSSFSSPSVKEKEQQQEEEITLTRPPTPIIETFVVPIATVATVTTTPLPPLAPPPPKLGAGAAWHGNKKNQTSTSSSPPLTPAPPTPSVYPPPPPPPPTLAAADDEVIAIGSSSTPPSAPRINSGGSSSSSRSGNSAAVVAHWSIAAAALTTILTAAASHDWALL